MPLSIHVSALAVYREAIVDTGLQRCRDQQPPVERGLKSVVGPRHLSTWRIEP
jgi:hypothetical protein